MSTPQRAELAPWKWLHPCLLGLQDTGPLLLPGDFGKQLSHPSRLTESVAAVLAKGMARMGWRYVGGWGTVGPGAGRRGEPPGEASH